MPATAAVRAPLWRAAETGRRRLSSTAWRPSKLGRTPITVPEGVDVHVGEPRVRDDPTTYLRVPRQTVAVSGRLGTMEHELPSFVRIAYDVDQRQLRLSVDNNTLTSQREMWGTTWSYIRSYIMGVSEGHTAILRLVGVGYRATVEERPGKAEYAGQKFVCLRLGYSHPIELGAPPGVAASAPQPTRILLEGPRRETVMQYAADIREWRIPEPYKGKGIFVNDETVKLKQKRFK